MSKRKSADSVARGILAAATSKVTVSPPRKPIAPGADAALAWYGEQLRFIHRRSDGAVVAKWVAADAVASAFGRDAQISPRLPEGTLYFGTGNGRQLLVQLHPAALRRITLSVSGPIQATRPGQRRTDLTVHVPPLLSFAVGSELFLFALKSTQQVSDKTRLYVTPLPNTYEDGRICWGANAHSDTLKLLDVYWHSEFTANVVEHKSAAFPADVRQQLLRCQDAPYPVDDLRPSRLTVADMLDKVKRALQHSEANRD